jgi:hypothetical protein
MSIKKCIAVQMEIIYDSQPTNRKPGGLPARTRDPLWSTPIGRLEVIYDSQGLIRRPGGQAGSCAEKAGDIKNLLVVVLCIRKKGCIGAHYTYLFLFQKDL